MGKRGDCTSVLAPAAIKSLENVSWDALRFFRDEIAVDGAFTSRLLQLDNVAAKLNPQIRTNDASLLYSFRRQLVEWKRLVIDASFASASEKSTSRLSENRIDGTQKPWDELVVSNNPLRITVGSSVSEFMFFSASSLWSFSSFHAQPQACSYELKANIPPQLYGVWDGKCRKIWKVEKLVCQNFELPMFKQFEQSRFSWIQKFMDSKIPKISEILKVLDLSFEIWILNVSNSNTFKFQQSLLIFELLTVREAFEITGFLRCKISTLEFQLSNVRHSVILHFPSKPWRAFP